MNKMNKKGFTLIEMLVVIAIIAVLVSIIVPTVSSATTKATAATNAANLRTTAASLTIEATQDSSVMDALKTGVAGTGGKFTFGSGATAKSVAAPLAKALSCDSVSITKDQAMFASIVNGELVVVYGDNANGVTIATLSDIAEDGKVN